MRFLFLYPTRRAPGGGHKQMRLLASNVRKLGGEAFLVREDEAVDDSAYYGVPVPAMSGGVAALARAVAAQDVLFLPEYRLDEWLERLQTVPCRRAVYAQGGFLALAHRPPGGYSKWSIELMIGVSPYIVALAGPYLGLHPSRSYLVPYSVVRGAFAEPPPRFTDKQLAVAFMPRKLRDHAEAVRSRVARHYPHVPWLAIDGLTEQEVARTLEKAAVFFSTQNGEGFGLPAIEAMARGCIVAGYRGTGLFPHPYATRGNGLWAQDRSIRRAAHQVRAALEIAHEADHRLRRLQDEALRTLAAYTPERALTGLSTVLEAIQAGEYSAPPSTARLGLRGHFQAWRTLRVARSLRQSGRLAAPS